MHLLRVSLIARSRVIFESAKHELSSPSVPHAETHLLTLGLVIIADQQTEVTVLRGVIELSMEVIQRAKAMTRVVLKSTVGRDGILHLTLPPEAAGQDVTVIVEPLSKRAMTQEEWKAWVQEMAGSITDPNFERPEQLPLEEREQIS